MTSHLKHKITTFASRSISNSNLQQTQINHTERRKTKGGGASEEGVGRPSKEGDENPRSLVISFFCSACRSLPPNPSPPPPNPLCMKSIINKTLRYSCPAPAPREIATRAGPLGRGREFGDTLLCLFVGGLRGHITAN